jgi:hypothetical protein
MNLKLSAGLDDVATERQMTSGWSFVVLPTAAVAQFSADAQKILPSGRKEFHAKSMNTGDTADCLAHRNFLSLLRKTAEANHGSFLAFSVNNETWHVDVTSYADRLVTEIFANLGITDRAVADGAKDAAPSLFTLHRLLNSPAKTEATVTLLQIDTNTTMGRFAAKTVTINGKSMHATRLLAALANGYRRQLFPQAPELDAAAIAVVDSEASFLVQGADVLGNFAMNYLIRNLATTTPGRTKKAQIFEDVFKDLLPKTQFSQIASLSGPALEPALKQAGALTFVVDHA